MKFNAIIITLLFSITSITGRSQQVQYPSTLHYIDLTIEAKPARMAYMDILPSHPNQQTVLLLHGKNFNGYYWKDVIPMLTAKGYRVIVPDQIGWGRSDKPNIHYSFHQLAYNTKALLDTLGISRIIVLGHSMGGMLASRFTLLYPQMVTRLVLENPIGLEDYKTFVPYRTIDKSYSGELKASYESYKKYQQSYYPVWKPEYEQYVQAQAESLQDADFPATAMANAITYQMIYEQPVVYELVNIKAPTLLIIGQADRTVVGKDQLDDVAKKKYGNYPQLGKLTNKRIAGSRLIELPGIGHIPHVQDPEAFKRAVLSFL